MNGINRISTLLIRSPLLWGALATLGFYTLLDSGQLAALAGEEVGDYFRRYFSSHWITYAEGAMFFFGVAALVLKLVDLLGQRGTLTAELLEPVPAGGQTADDCPSLLSQLAAAPAGWQDSYLVKRLRAGLEYVQRRGTAEGLDDELKYLADVDAAQAHGSYALVRIIVWAIPILGFLGTVTGITLAIANLAPQALEESLSAVTAGLGVAFDTTAVALAESIILMFGQFLCDRLEGRLLAGVDERISREFSGRFQQSGTGGDPQVAAIRRMADAVIQGTERMVQRQVDVWKATIDAAQEQWSQAATAMQQQMHSVLGTALAQSLEAHARTLGQSAQSAAEHNQQHWQSVQQSLEEMVAAATRQHQELSRQGDILRQVVESTGQVAKLEDTLNRNLAALASSHNFEETLQSLAAVIHLLNARLGQAPSAAALGSVKNRNTGQAA